MEVPDKIQNQENCGDDSFTGNQSDTLSDILFSRTKSEFRKQTQNSLILNDNKSFAEDINPNAETSADDTIFLKPSKMLLGRTSVSRSRKSIDRNGILNDMSNTPLPLRKRRTRQKLWNEEINIFDSSSTSSRSFVAAPKRQKLQAREMPHELINFSGNADANDNSVVLKPRRRPFLRDILEGQTNAYLLPAFDSVDTDSYDDSVILERKRRHRLCDIIGSKTDINPLPEFDSVTSYDSPIENRKVGVINESVTENEINKRSRFDPARVDFEIDFSYTSTVTSSQTSENEIDESKQFDMDSTLRSKDNEDESKIELDGDETPTYNANSSNECISSQSAVTESDKSAEANCSNEYISSQSTITESDKSADANCSNECISSQSTVTESDKLAATLTDNHDACESRNFSKSANTSLTTPDSNFDVDVTANMNLMEVVDVTVDRSANNSNVLQKLPTLGQIYRDMVVSMEESLISSLPMIKNNSTTRASVEIDELRNCEAVAEILPNVHQSMSDSIARPQTSEANNVQLSPESTKLNFSERIVTESFIRPVEHIEKEIIVESAKLSSIMITVPISEQSDILDGLENVEISQLSLPEQIDRLSERVKLIEKQEELSECGDRVNIKAHTVPLHEKFENTEVIKSREANEISPLAVKSSSNVDETASQHSCIDTLQISLTEPEINSDINSLKENTALSDAFQCTDLKNNINSSTYCVDKTVEDSVTCIIPRIVFTKDMNCTYTICRENSNEISLISRASKDNSKQIPPVMSEEPAVVNEDTLMPEPMEIVIENSEVDRELSHQTITNDLMVNTEGGVTVTKEIAEPCTHGTDDISMKPENISFLKTKDHSCINGTVNMSFINHCEDDHAKKIAATCQNTENETVVNIEPIICIENAKNNNSSNPETSFKNLNEPNMVDHVTTVEGPVISSECIQERLLTQEITESNKTEESFAKNVDKQVNANDKSDNSEIFSINRSSFRSMTASEPKNSLRRSSRISYYRAQSADKSKCNDTNDSAFSFFKNVLTNKSVPNVRRETQSWKEKNAKHIRCFNIDDLDESIQKLRKKPIFPKHFHSYCNDRFYAYLIRKMTPKYGARTNYEVVRVAEYIWQTVEEVEATNDPIEYNAKVKEMKKCLYRKQLLKTHYDFHMWCHHYMPQRFKDKAVPKLWNPDVEFNPHTLYEDICTVVVL